MPDVLLFAGLFKKRIYTSLTSRKGLRRTLAQLTSLARLYNRRALTMCSDLRMCEK